MVDADERADGLLKWWGDLKAQRNSFDDLWQTITDLVFPDGPDFTGRSAQQGERRTERQYDSTVTLALFKFAAVMESLLTPRLSKWHRVTSTNPELNKVQRVKVFWDDAAEKLFRARKDPRARYYSHNYDTLLSMGAYGNRGMLILPRPTGGIQYRALPLDGLWVALDAEGVVNTVFRRYELEAKECVRIWGDKAPERARTAKSPFEKLEFLHVIMPRTDIDYEAPGFRSMPWASIEIAVKDRKIMSEGGYTTWPLPFGRYVRSPREDYGRGPATMVLPHVGVVNEQKRTHLEAGELIARPPVLLPADGLIGSKDAGGTIDLRSGSLVYGGVDDRGNQLARPFVNGGNPAITREMIQDEQQIIQDPFLVNLFQILIETPQRTATEVLELVREKGILIAPTVGRQHDEWLGPQIEAELDILEAQGKLGEMPPELIEAQGEYEIVYDSPATHMMRSEEMLGVQQMLELAFAMAERFPSQAPRIEAMISVPDIIRLQHEVGGAPARVLRGEDEVEAIMAREAQAAQEAQAVEQLPAVAKGMRDLAQAAPALEAVA